MRHLHKNIAEAESQLIAYHLLFFVKKKTKTLESNPFNIQRLWGLTLPQLFKKTGETKRGVFSDLGNFMSSTKFTLRSELFLVLKFYFKESLLSKKKISQKSAHQNHELYDISKSKGTKKKRGTAVPFLVRAFTPPGLSSKKLGSTDLQRASHRRSNWEEGHGRSHIVKNLDS